MSDSDSDSDCRLLDDGPAAPSSKTQKTSSSVFNSFSGNLTSASVLSSILPRKTASYVDPDVQMELNAMMGSTESSAVASLSAYQRHTGSPRNGSAKRTTETWSNVESAKPKPLKAASNVSAIDQAAKQELEAILQKPALTSEDKYRVLDARDKLIRLTTSSTTDISRAVTTKGVCPDMCPEKERLMREATHHVATFELEDHSRSVMRHSHALKQYSRSSADQQIPLAHELRPEPVLQMAMQFLLHHIVDLCESPDTNLADWFHFVWDRTRSIRKDISQQDLCSIGAVNLVEQCARLHIHCAGRLVAEEPQVFSSKINSENLTKCLQSLKYLYHDLQLRSISCSNEAEFRAYVVLLNLNDCQFFWEVKQLPHSILHSPQIQFAIKVYLALESNNFVRFFRLVRETSYMNACILMRYFTQMRVIALEMMLKTYSPRSTVFMEISHWQYVLAFEDFEQTAQFFEYYGMRCDRDADRVFLDRNAFIYPDIPFMLDRAIYLVEHKRTCSVGETIHGAPLSNFEAQFSKYEPHDSFDDRGYLYAEAWTADDQNYSRPATPKTRITPSPVFRKSTTPPPRSPSPRPPPALSPTPNHFFKMPLPPPPSKSPQPHVKPKVSPKRDHHSPDIEETTVGSIFGNALQSDTFIRPTPVNRNIFGSSEFAQPQTQSSSSGFKFSLDLGASASSAPHQPFSLNLAASATAQNIFGGITEPAAINTFSFAPQPTTAPTVAPHPVVTRSLSKEEAQQQRIIEETQAHCQALTDELLDECIAEETSIIVRQEIAKRQAARSAEIDALAVSTFKELLDEHIQSEIHEALQEMLREATQSNTAKYFARWRHIVRQRIERRARIDNTPIWIEPQRTRAELSVPQHQITMSQRLRYRQGLAPTIQLPTPTHQLIDVFQLMPTIKSSAKNQYWKCLLSIPRNHPPETSVLLKWLNGIIQRRSPPLADVFFTERHRVQDGTNTNVCLRLLQGSQMIDSSTGTPATRDHFKGSHAIVFFHTSTESTEECEARQSQMQRLQIPIEHVHHQPTRQSVADALRRLAKLTLIPTTSFSDLRMQRTTDFLLQTLGDQFWHSIRKSALSNPALQQTMRDPCSVVIIYNEAIRRLIEIASEDHDCHPEFPPELRRFVPPLLVDVPSTLEHFPDDWKQSNRSQRIVDFLTQLQLSPPSNFLPSSVEALHKQIHVYCASQSDTNIADQILSAVLTSAQSHISALDALREFARIGPSMLSYARLSQQFNKHVQTIPSHIIYNATKLKHFCQQPWWLTFDASPVHTVRINHPATSKAVSHQSPAPQRPSIIDASEMDALVARATSIIRNADTKIAQRRLELDAAQRRRSDGAAQLEEHLRRYDLHTRRHKRMIADDDELQKTAVRARPTVEQNFRSAASGVDAPVATSKKRRISNAASVADISNMRSFVWLCYEK